MSIFMIRLHDYGPSSGDLCISGEADRPTLALDTSP
jgi:hypothetical protein